MRSSLVYIHRDRERERAYPTSSTRTHVYIRNSCLRRHYLLLLLFSCAGQRGRQSCRQAALPVFPPLFHSDYSNFSSLSLSLSLLARQFFRRALVLASSIPPSLSLPSSSCSLLFFLFCARAARTLCLIFLSLARSFSLSLGERAGKESRTVLKEVAGARSGAAKREEGKRERGERANSRDGRGNRKIRTEKERERERERKE